MDVAEHQPAKRHGCRIGLRRNISMGEYYHYSCSAVNGINSFLLVDLYVVGCLATNEALMYGVFQLQKKIRCTKGTSMWCCI
jgi:NADH:ubiquinone oxidoreductase subunit B-like Fe-S oxidoreductase